MRERDRMRGRCVGVCGPAALKRDLWRIAKAEDRTFSETCIALLRLGLTAYFELCCHDPAAERLKARLEEKLLTGSFEEIAGERGPRARRAPEFLRRREARQQNEREFDAAVEAGQWP